MKIVNFGSMNLDYVYQVPHFLAPGETMSAVSQQVHPGGKGLNQSIAAARAGAQVYHAGAVGAGGEQLKALLADNGVDVTYLAPCDALQGNAIIQVAPSGENCILLFGGSNQAITPAQVAQTLAHFDAGDVLLLQNEVSCLPQMVETAAAKGMRIILNPSPFDERLLSLPLNKLEWLFINEVEGGQITGKTAAEDILAALAARYPSLKVVLTLGGEGSVCMAGDKRIHQPIFRVHAVDTTAAGDTFTGFFVAALEQGLPLESCMKRAAAAAAISVSRPGASSSIPTAAEVDELLAKA